MGCESTESFGYRGYDLKLEIFANDNSDLGMPFMKVNSTDGI